MTELPDDVKLAQQVFLRDPSNELVEISKKLIVNTSDLVKMWRTLDRRKYPHDPAPVWVFEFLSIAKEAADLPAFHYKPANERRELAASIQDLATRLGKTLMANGLDAHLVYSDGKIFNGFFLYEDFGEKNRASFDTDGSKKLKLSVLLKNTANRMQKTIAEEPMPGKSGANVRAVRFVRIIAARNQRWYGEPLNAATAAAANAIFGTDYNQSDIRKLVSR